MEQGAVLSAGPGALTPEELARRLAAAGPPGRRRAPRGFAEVAGGTLGFAPATGGRRGDHDLNPEFGAPAGKLVPAAVLVPVVTHDHGLTVLLTRRSDHLNDHAGQISFPGGRIDAADPGPRAAALRETAEEVGLGRERIELLGELDTYVTRTGFEVTPLVGLVRPPFEVRPDPFEVAEIFEVPLAFFLAPGSRRVESRVYKGQRRHFFVYPYRHYYIWGATAGMLSNLVEILGGGAAPWEG